jgi:hypothetical protein
MSVNVKLSKSLVEQAKLAAASQRRSIAEQVEHWSRIGRTMEQNPDLPLALIREILTADQEHTISEYQPGAQSK